MTKVNPENGNETKHDIFLGTYSNMMLFFVKKHSSISKAFKTKISQFYDLSKPKQWQ